MYEMPRKMISQSARSANQIRTCRTIVSPLETDRHRYDTVISERQSVVDGLEAGFDRVDVKSAIAKHLRHLSSEAHLVFYDQQPQAVTPFKMNLRQAY